MSYKRTPSPHDSSYEITVHGPLQSDGASWRFISGPHKDCRTPAAKFIQQYSNVLGHPEVPSNVEARIVEHGGDQRSWTWDHKHGGFVLDPIDQVEKAPMQIGGDA